MTGPSQGSCLHGRWENLINTSFSKKITVSSYPHQIVNYDRLLQTYWRCPERQFSRSFCDFPRLLGIFQKILPALRRFKSQLHPPNCIALIRRFFGSWMSQAVAYLLADYGQTNPYQGSKPIYIQYLTATQYKRSVDLLPIVSLTLIHCLHLQNTCGDRKGLQINTCDGLRGQTLT